MAGHRFFIESNQSTSNLIGNTTTLSATDSHHAIKVLRLKPEDTVFITTTPDGRRFEGRILDIDGLVTVQLLNEITEQHSKCRVDAVLFGICKGDHNDLVAEKLTELGVSRIICYQADRSVVRLAASDYSKRLTRYQRIAETAAKQCGRLSLPKISIYPSLRAGVEHLTESGRSSNTLFFCSLQKNSKLPHQLPVPINPVHCTIGPEGDFSPADEQLLIAAGFEPVSLGPLVLRSETAAIVAVSMFNGAWGYAE